MKILAVIPARGGSKGLPGKNLMNLCGKSLVARAAEFSLTHAKITHSIISTDDEKIAREAIVNGLDCPFMRPSELSSDHASSLDAWKHALLNAESFYNTEFDYSVLLEPTSPLREHKDLDLVFGEVIKNQRDTVVTVSIMPAHFSPHKTLIINGGKLGTYLNDGVDYSNRHKIPVYYHRNGVAYVMSREKLLNTSLIIDDDSFAVVIDRPLVNIDEHHDFLYAKFLLESRNK